MTRYTIQMIRKDERAAMGFDPRHPFIGWDDLDGESVEATKAANLGKRMPANARATFLNLKPGQTKIDASGNRYFRDY